ncbi:MAG TPA: dUTP diphosphatase [Solirubrobacteraceae bacterium]
MAIADAVDVLEVQLLDPAARVPERAREGDAGYDLRALEGFVLAPGARRLVGTGIALAIPPGLAGLVLPRSGLAARHGVTTLNAPGLIDPNYRGEVKVVLHNAGAEPYAAAAGDRIAQLLLVPFCSPSLAPVEALPPGAGGRGADGFGSSGR